MRYSREGGPRPMVMLFLGGRKNGEGKMDGRKASRDFSFSFSFSFFFLSAKKGDGGRWGKGGQWKGGGMLLTRRRLGWRQEEV